MKWTYDPTVQDVWTLGVYTLEREGKSWGIYRAGSRWGTADTLKEGKARVTTLVSMEASQPSWDDEDF